MLVVSPLCQKPPSPMNEIDFFADGTLNAAAEAGPRPYPIVEAPMLNGGRIENRWQPMSAAMWCGPSSFSTSFIAAKIGRSGHPVQKPGGRGGTAPASALMRGSSAIAGMFGAQALSASAPGAAADTKARTPLSITSGVYSPAIG